jgi:hypothetical protein
LQAVLAIPMQQVAAAAVLEQLDKTQIQVIHLQEQMVVLEAILHLFGQAQLHQVQAGFMLVVVVLAEVMVDLVAQAAVAMALVVALQLRELQIQVVVVVALTERLAEQVAVAEL